MEVVALTMVLGCASAHRENDDDRIPGHSASVIMNRDGLTPVPTRTGDVLTARELAATPGLIGATAYDAVLRLRAGFLHPRDARMSTIAARGILPAVFVSGMYYGEAEVLRLISISAVEEMQYVRPFEAMSRYGSDYRAGVILVRLKRGPTP